MRIKISVNRFELTVVKSKLAKNENEKIIMRILVVLLINKEEKKRI